MKIDPSARCPCGSKKKYRDCCKRKKDRDRTIMFIVGLALAIVAAKVLFQEEPAAPPGQVWSPEHGHYHDANPGNSGIPPAGSQAGQAGSPLPQTGQNIPQPPGAVPTGKVWSPDHGHWHDISPPGDSGTITPQQAGQIPQPDGPVPPGKVWSPEHEHWHDVQ